MTDQQHPITPPPELVQQWLGEFFGCTVNGGLSDSERYLATQAARWGADQELEACCEWLDKGFGDAGNFSVTLCADRRPKPPSLKELALKTLQKLSVSEYPCNYQGDDDWDTIRRALELLDD